MNEVDNNSFFLFLHNFKQSDAQKSEEPAVVEQLVLLNSLRLENLSTLQRGTFSFISDNGQPYTVQFWIPEFRNKNIHF